MQCKYTCVNGEKKTNFIATTYFAEGSYGNEGRVWKEKFIQVTLSDLQAAEGLNVKLAGTALQLKHGGGALDIRMPQTRVFHIFEDGALVSFPTNNSSILFMFSLVTVFLRIQFSS